MKYAGAFKRFAAFFVDSLILLGAYMAFGFLFHLSTLYAPLAALPMVGFWWFGGISLSSWLYYASFESSKRQATLGKQVLGLKVTDQYGCKISFWRATGRYFGKFLSRLLFCIGFLMVFFTKKKQALHDKMADTLVINSRS